MDDQRHRMTSIKVSKDSGKRHLKEEVKEFHKIVTVIDGVDRNQLFIALHIIKARRY